MWDVVIDEGSKRAGIRATGCAIRRDLAEPTPKDFSVSNHEWSYWISGAFLHLGMTVHKDTETGRQLTTMLKENATGNAILEFLLPVFLAHVPPIKLQNAVKSAVAYAHAAGRREKAEEIRAALKAD
jgi:hypothetical protein